MLTNAEEISDWFAKNRYKLSGNGNWFQGAEPNTLPAGYAQKAPVKVLICRLSSYKDVARGITHSYLYQLATSVDDVYADLAFFPEFADEKLLAAAKIPLWTGTTSKMPAGQFDLLAISNSVLQELINLPAALHFSGIPLSRSAREAHQSPLVLIGGSNAYNLSAIHGRQGDGLVDGVLVGDGETTFAAIISIIKNNRHLNRDDLLELLANKVEGFYNPVSYRQEFSAAGELTGIKPAENAPFPVVAAKKSCTGSVSGFAGGPLLYDETAAGASHLLLTAGCPAFCSFCKESWEQKPYRERPLADLLTEAMKLKASMGLSEVALMSFNANTYTDIFPLVNELKKKFGRVSIKSQRFDAVVYAPELLDLQFDTGKRTYTCAMEGISERLRTLLQKNLDEKTIMQGISELMMRKMRQLKVFVIITGYEVEDDFAEFASFLGRLKNMLSQANCRASLMFSFATLFRPPHTPMQFAQPRMGFSDLEKALQRARDTVVYSGFQARISSGPADAEASEMLAYADRRFLPVLTELSVTNGFRYRGEISRELFSAMQAAMNRLKLVCQANLPKNVATVFPWDDIDTGINKKFLFNNYQQLVQGRQLESCIGKPWGGGACVGCNACKTVQEKEKLTKAGPPVDAAFKLATLPKVACTPVKFEVPQQWAMCGKNFIKAALARRLMLDNPELVGSFVRVAKVFPEFYTGGCHYAEIEFSRPVKELKTGLITESPDISAVQILCQKPLLWPVTIDFICREPVAVKARQIDAFLSKYRLKNLKQRSQNWLNWAVNKGQAKKAGIAKISMNEQTGKIKMILTKSPELFMLNQLAGSAAINCADFTVA